MTIKVLAPAKINLALHVVGRREDGYHLLDSLVAFCSIGDVLSATRSDATTFAVTGAYADAVPMGEDNLVLRAARAFCGDLDVALTLHKELPPQSGIGGGSADAAATIRALKMLRAGPEAKQTDAFGAGDLAKALRLGADVPVCLESRPARMRGIGEEITPLPPLPDCAILLVNPHVGVPTPAVFAALEHRQNAPMPAVLPQWRDAPSMAIWLSNQRNDLEAPATAIAPVIGEVLSRLAALDGSLLARMSGSGATCFALFASEEAALLAADLVRAARPDWWVAPGRLLAAPPEPDLS